MEKGDRQHHGPKQVAGSREPQRTLRPAPGKVTPTSKMTPNGGQVVQRKGVTISTESRTPPKQSLWDFTMDPAMDAAHRGAAAPSSSSDQVVQAQESDEADAPASGHPAAGDPFQELQRRIAQAEQLLSSGDVPVEKRAALRTALNHARTELAKLQALRSQGQGRKEALGGLGLATAGVLADDATVVGVADDWLLILLGLAAVGTYIITSAPASQGELEQAQRNLGRALQELGNIVEPLMMAKAGDHVRGLTGQIAIHLARMLGETVAGKPPDHQGGDPNRDRKHWWKEIKAWLQKIKDQGLSSKQLMRELQKKFTEAEIQQIREALRKAAQMMGEEPPFMF